MFFFLADKNWFEDLLDLYRYLIIKMLLVSHKLWKRSMRKIQNIMEGRNWCNTIMLWLVLIRWINSNLRTWLDKIRQDRSAINIKVLQKYSVDERSPLIIVSTFDMPASRFSLLFKHSFFFASLFLKNFFWEKVNIYGKVLT